MDISALIFDFDGTLAELNLDFAALARSIEGMARREGLEGPWPEGFLLESLDEVGRILGPAFLERAMDFLVSREVAAAEQGRLFPFSRGLLASARERGVRLGVISRNCGPAIQRVFPEVEQECDVFLPRERVSHTKPDPRHITAALEAMKVPPSRAVVVGDHWMDVQTGLKAGCLTVGVASGRVPASELAQSGAQLVLPDASGLLVQLEIWGAKLGPA